MRETILIVEDEQRMRSLLVDYLSHEGYRIVEAQDGDEALLLFKQFKVDLVLLDIMMPRMDGFAVCRSLRKQSGVRIVILTAKSQDYDKLTGYGLGADDYVTKPFSPKVLVAKINAIIKRARSDSMHKSNEPNGFIINQKAREVRIDGNLIPLSRIEYDLLSYLYCNPNIVLSRDQILDAVWGYNYDGDIRTVDTHIKRIRQKLMDKADWIKTIKGYGYKWKMPQ